MPHRSPRRGRRTRARRSPRSAPWSRQTARRRPGPRCRWPGPRSRSWTTEAAPRPAAPRRGPPSHAPRASSTARPAHPVPPPGWFGSRPQVLPRRTSAACTSSLTPHLQPPLVRRIANPVMDTRDGREYVSIAGYAVRRVLEKQASLAPTRLRRPKMTLPEITTSENWLDDAEELL